MSELPPYQAPEHRGDDESRVLVCGGRDYRDRFRVFDAMNQFRMSNRNLIVIHGACCERSNPLQLRGADRWVQEWAMEYEVPYIGVPAKWRSSAQGNLAGPVRIVYMFARFQPTSVIAFPGGTGTKRTIEAAWDRGLIVWEPFGTGLIADTKARIARRRITSV